MADNADQVAFWNDGPGLTWAARADALDALHAPVTDLLLAEIGPIPGARVADIGCGAGALTLALAARAGPEGRVAGLDVSRPLLEVARARAGDDPRIAFLEADAEDHPFAEGALDLVASRFGVMFFGAPETAFANLARALRPGGRLVLATWAAAAENPWFAEAERCAAARLGVPAPPPPPPLAPGPTAFREPARVLPLLARAGFAHPAARRRSTHLAPPGGLAGAARLATAVGPVSRLLREHGGTETDRAAIQDALAAAFARHDGPDGPRIPAVLQIYTAARTT